ncbi:hypothetical protein FS749_005597 [Ceratobasidium sp. UAMH 11750]|nr:hypothetical protein FS749_005597 [Ceratobasidium sp. UAMH 11750]
MLSPRTPMDEYNTSPTGLRGHIEPIAHTRRRVYGEPKANSDVSSAQESAVHYPPFAQASPDTNSPNVLTTQPTRPAALPQWPWTSAIFTRLSQLPAQRRVHEARFDLMMDSVGG